MGKDRVRKKLEQVAAAAGDRARQRGSQVLERWVRLHHRGADSWFLRIDTPATVLDDASRGDAKLDIACTVDAPLNRTLAVLDDPGDLLDFLNDPETDIRHPLNAAMVYELVHPGGIDRQLRALLGTVRHDSPAATAEASVDAFLQQAGRAMSRRYPHAQISFNVDVAGLGTRSLRLVDGAPVVAQAPLGRAKCDIRMDRTVLEAVLADPVAAVAALVQGDLQVSNACRARQLAMSLWHDALEQLLPLDLYVTLYDPAATEFPSGGVNHQTYVLVNGQTHKITFTDIDGDGVVEGDIVIGRTEDLLEVARRVEQQTAGPKLEGAILRDWGNPTAFLWKDNTLYYKIEDDLEDPDRIADAIEMFADLPLTFREGEGDGDYVLIKQANYSNSEIGRIGGKQTLNLSPSAPVGTVAHELCHALGMWHEQARYDRDEWVEIIEDNVEDWERRAHNFERKTPSVNQYDPIEPAWDFNSIPPETPEDRERRWVVGTSATGVWRGHENQIAEWDEATAQWTFITPEVNNLVRLVSKRQSIAWNGTDWVRTPTLAQDLFTYDYGSIMHYRKTAFGKKKNSCKAETTIKALKPLDGKTMGQRRELSQTDKDTLNAMYATDGPDGLDGLDGLDGSGGSGGSSS